MSRVMNGRESNAMLSRYIPRSSELTISLILPSDDASEEYDDDDDDEEDADEEKSAGDCALASVVLKATVVQPETTKADPRSGNSKRRMVAVGTFIPRWCNVCEQENVAPTLASCRQSGWVHQHRIWNSSRWSIKYIN
jgi:hypothetical protein